MNVITLTESDFRQPVNGRRLYCGSIDPAGFPGDVEIVGGLGTVWFPKLRATGSIRAYAGTSIRSTDEIVASWNVWSAGSLSAGYMIIAGAGITAEGYIYARRGIRAGDYISSGGSIRTRGSIVGGWEVTAKGSITALSITSRDTIVAGGNITVDAGVIAGLSIECGGILSGGRIFAGVSDLLDDYPADKYKLISCERLDSGRVCYGVLRERNSEQELL